MKKLAQGFNTAAQDSNPGSLSRESGGLPLSHCALRNVSLEMVRWSAARIVMQIRLRDRQSMTTILRQLDWLQVRERIEYKLLVLVHRALYGGTPEYLAALLL